MTDLKIAIVGTQQASQGLAPWADPSWKIWACSTDQIKYPRVDEHFELHNLDWGVQREGQKEIEYLGALAKKTTVWVAHPSQWLPNAKPLPKDALIAEFGPYFFTSSIAWMMAKAIMDGATEIGPFGIEMHSSSEYGLQRPGCQFFLWEAKKRGIKVSAPLESSILRHPPMYGYREFSPMYRKMWVLHQAALAKQLEAQQVRHEASMREAVATGLLEHINYDMNIWAGE